MSSLLKVVFLIHRGSRIAGKGRAFNVVINLTEATVGGIVAEVQDLQ